MRALDVYSSLDRMRQECGHVGGGLVGSEAGLHLAKNGRQVTVVEMLDSSRRIPIRFTAWRWSTRWSAC